MPKVCDWQGPIERTREIGTPEDKMRKIAIAGLQFDMAVGDNLEVLGREIRLAKARQPWLEMIVLSELCTYGPDIRRAQASGGVAEMHFCRLARECGVWLNTRLALRAAR
jgi:hypothetical protein